MILLQLNTFILHFFYESYQKALVNRDCLCINFHWFSNTWCQLVISFIQNFRRFDFNQCQSDVLLIHSSNIKIHFDCQRIHEWMQDIILWRDLIAIKWGWSTTAINHWLKKLDTTEMEKSKYITNISCFYSRPSLIDVV